MIPKVIYQSWKTKDLPYNMRENVRTLRRMNPEYEYVLYDDEDCRKFLLKEYGKKYAKAFDALIPGAFKCDFWRYAMLYKYGGVYIDMDMVPMVPLREIVGDRYTFVSVVDRYWEGLPGIYQAFFACEPKNEIVGMTLRHTLENINNRYIGPTLNITGPAVMGNAFNKFMNKEPKSNIKVGIYRGNIMLYDATDNNYVRGLNGEPFFKLKFDGFNDGVPTYGNSDVYHPYKFYEKPSFLCFVGLLCFLIVLLILRHRIKNDTKSDIPVLED